MNSRIRVNEDSINRSIFYFLHLSAVQTRTGTSANTVEPDEMAHNESSHLDLHCFPFSF